MIKVLLVDDHDLVRTGIKRLLEDSNVIKVVAEMSTGEDAVKYCRENDPDVVLMDVNMPGIGGLEATRKILRYKPDMRLIILTVQVEEPFPTTVMQIGASGFLTKNTPPSEMIQAIRAVKTGQRYITPDIAQQMALAQFNKKDESPFASLSERELQIMMMITRGEKVVDISDKLSLSSKTVNSYRYRMFEKLSVNNDVELTHLAIRYGLLNTDRI
ncbi:UvrY/SirA/GacA family response regulator transcription factor [Thalassotalea sp. HSM 43]|uniref:UvrY/SirA/GacA family response regulator transcription factor n=1 Tax=unclassified Thalassotalea TaxID=2614972 RepID=UPI0010809043|nr:UvrY/SirA/GacA family response regulator transcription factor [Thalassotalea sp. HSM 43]NMP15269.1 UvrY/SirA/GacA family response regulator transcription factor [Thalassotalea sp. Y01]QBY02865.1 two-component system response regulator UvrY [Thalassotalea sp. HSM 43]